MFRRKNCKLIFLQELFLLTGLALLQPAHLAAAAGTTGSATSSAAAWDPHKQFFDFRYKAEFSGPTFQDPDGQKDGPGPNLEIYHELRPGYYLGDGWKTRLVFRGDQHFLSSETSQRRWEFLDPAVGAQ